MDGSLRQSSGPWRWIPQLEQPVDILRGIMPELDPINRQSKEDVHSNHALKIRPGAIADAARRGHA